jgi:endo-1,4-beta-D-glucanase Y
MKKQFAIRLTAILFILIGLIGGLYITYRNSGKADEPLVFSDKTMLSALYNDYKQEYWEEETGRTLDKQNNSITTSEGQSYTMLRAVWESDKATFDKTWEWTKDHIKRQEDALFSWKWGQKPDGSYGVLTEQGGFNTASDADVDISFALLMAAGRWQQQSYLDEAKTIINDIWEVEVVAVDGMPYLASNSLEKNSKSDIVMNVSYLAPYAFREFAKVDPQHDWMRVVDSSYDLIRRASQDKLNKAASAGLPPDWIAMNRTTGAIRASDNGDLTTNYSFDAMRTPWRLALDHQWNGEPRAKETLQLFSFLGEHWRDKGVLYSTYGHDGEALIRDEVPAIYGGDLGFFKVVDEPAGKEIYDQKLKTLYDQNINGWVDGVSYYSDNWGWFGMALFGEQLDNPIKQLKEQ